MDRETAINHAIKREYMHGVERDKQRVSVTQEVFTPDHSVQHTMDHYDYSDPDLYILDPTCGDGQYLAHALVEKLKCNIDFEIALSTIQGVDYREDNVLACQERLLCGSTDPKHIEIVKRNIVHADSFYYHFRFDGTPGETKEQYETRIKNEREQAAQEKKRLKDAAAKLKKLEKRLAKQKQLLDKKTVPDTFHPALDKSIFEKW